MVDERVMKPIVNSVQRLYTRRENFEALVIERAVQQKEEVLGRKIHIGSPEYLETVKNVRSLDLETLEQFFNSMN